LTLLYVEKIQLGNLDLPVPKPNATRFKEKLLLAVPGLTDISFGKQVFFMFEKELSLAVEKYTEEEDEHSTLKKAARIIRTSMKNEEQNFDGYFSKDCQVHKSLYDLVLICLIYLYIFLNTALRNHNRILLIDGCIY